LLFLTEISLQDTKSLALHPQERDWVKTSQNCSQIHIRKFRMCNTISRRSIELNPAIFDALYICILHIYT